MVLAGLQLCACWILSASAVPQAEPQQLRRLPDLDLRPISDPRWRYGFVDNWVPLGPDRLALLNIRAGHASVAIVSARGNSGWSTESVVTLPAGTVEDTPKSFEKLLRDPAGKLYVLFQASGRPGIQLTAVEPERTDSNRVLLPTDTRPCEDASYSANGILLLLEAEKGHELVSCGLDGSVRWRRGAADKLAWGWSLASPDDAHVLLLDPPEKCAFQVVSSEGAIGAYTNVKGLLGAEALLIDAAGSGTGPLFLCARREGSASIYGVDRAFRVATKLVECKDPSGIPAFGIASDGGSGFWLAKLSGFEKYDGGGHKTLALATGHERGFDSFDGPVALTPAGRFFVYPASFGSVSELTPKGSVVQVQSVSRNDQFLDDRRFWAFNSELSNENRTRWSWDGKRIRRVEPGGAASGDTTLLASDEPILLGPIASWTADGGLAVLVGLPSGLRAIVLDSSWSVRWSEDLHPSEDSGIDPRWVSGITARGDFVAVWSPFGVVVGKRGKGIVGSVRRIYVEGAYPAGTPQSWEVHMATLANELWLANRADPLIVQRYELP
jgi:hypothetical protein